MKIRLEHLTKRFPNRNKKIAAEVVAVNDFDYCVFHFLIPLMN